MNGIFLRNLQRPPVILSTTFFPWSFVCLADFIPKPWFLFIYLFIFCFYPHPIKVQSIPCYTFHTLLTKKKKDENDKVKEKSETKDIVERERRKKKRVRRFNKRVLFFLITSFMCTDINSFHSSNESYIASKSEPETFPLRNVFFFF